MDLQQWTDRLAGLHQRTGSVFGAVLWRALKWLYLPPWLRTNETILVVGAGVSGLTAAQALTRAGAKVQVLEARDRLGGRVWTPQLRGVPIDAGASWIHGLMGNPILGWARRTGSKIQLTTQDQGMVFDPSGHQVAPAEVEARRARLEALFETWAESELDMSLEQALAAEAPEILEDPLSNMLLAVNGEFWGGGSLRRMGARFWDYGTGFGAGDAILPEGCSRLLEPLASGLQIQLECPVERVQVFDRSVKLHTRRGELEADRLVVTLPLGVLKSGDVEFEPAWPVERQQALERTAVGVVNKVALVFERAFWPVDSHFFAMPGTPRGRFDLFLNLRAFTPHICLVSYAVGDEGSALEHATDEDLLEWACAPLRRMFPGEFEPPTDFFRTGWGNDRWARGAYSYFAVESRLEDFLAIARPLGQRVFFAGEHTCPQFGATVHGAYLSGLRAAGEVLRVPPER